MAGLLTLRERDGQLEQAAFPDGLFFARDTAFPVFQIQNTLLCTGGLGVETERVVTPPLLPTRTLLEWRKPPYHAKYLLTALLAIYSGTEPWL